jgi:hypothetical protein
MFNELLWEWYIDSLQIILQMKSEQCKTLGCNNTHICEIDHIDLIFTSQYLHILHFTNTTSFTNRIEHFYVRLLLQLAKMIAIATYLLINVTVSLSNWRGLLGQFCIVTRRELLPYIVQHRTLGCLKWRASTPSGCCPHSCHIISSYCRTVLIINSVYYC